MARRLADTVVVVTGASSGIGRATTELLAERGATVVAVARREEPLERLAERYPGDDGRRGRRTGRVVAAPADVRDARAMERIAADTVAEHGRLDAWVNNAGVNQYGRFHELPIEEWHEVVATNLFGTAHGAHAAIPYFRDQGAGVLVNVSSLLGELPGPLQSAYVASKFAITGLSDALRQELRDVPGIAVTTVLPGPVDTPLFQHSANRTGYRITPPKPRVDAGRVARAIVHSIRSPRREVQVGSASTRPGRLARRAAPATVERAFAPIAAAAHLSDEPTPDTPGNVVDPVEAGVEVDGGWGPSRRGRVARTLLVASLLGVVAGLARRSAAR